jgi:hypothetical protein
MTPENISFFLKVISNKNPRQFPLGSFVLPLADNFYNLLLNALTTRASRICFPTTLVAIPCQD